MARIVVLAESIVSRIAAGEVVERPASALKELIENAIDARARRIEVDLTGGGRDGIVVTDDGDGMGPDDVLLALERHATSKIHSDADIEDVRTLGFRGEALPAIASVSQFTLTSRDDASEIATVVEVRGGRIASVRQSPAPRGTRVEVMGLFYNAPARRKFLRSAETERQRAAEMLTRVALAHPEIRFRLRSEGREVFDHAPVPDRRERVAQVFGRRFAERMLPVAASSAELSVDGLISPLSETRSHAREQHLFVNRRPVRDRLLSHAVAAACSDALPRGRHPVALLFLELPAAMVDVNVHPAKSEVRFRRSGEVHDFLVGALRAALRAGGAYPSLESRRGSGAWEPIRAPGARELDSFAGLRAAEPALPGTAGYAYAPSAFVTFVSDPRDGSAAAAGLGFERGAPLGGAEIPEVAGDASGTPTVSPLGQFLDSYILARDADGLVIVDQHAAHERILFEQIFERAAEGRVPVQRLLEAQTVEMAPGTSDSLESLLEPLQSIGFEIDPFGRDALILRGLPAALGPVDPAPLIREILAENSDRGVRGSEAPSAKKVPERSDRAEELRRAVAASAACHAAIKVHMPLNAAKMAWILTELFRCRTPMSCPHGRPSLLRIRREEIEKGFRRR